MSMQIVEKSGEGLSRVFGVTVPAATLSERLDQRIAEIRPQMNIKGFRPGKVPVAHVKRMYGKSLMSEIVDQAVNESQQQALSDGALRPAASPEINLSSDIEQVLAGSSDLSFELSVELMPEFTALYWPTINSYKRSVENTWAPTTATWGLENRTTAIRVIGGSAQAMRIEYRQLGADMNPYLGMAVSLAAGLWGIENEVEPPAHVQGNGYRASAAKPLPRSLKDAVELLRNSRRARALLGDGFVDHFIRTREWEVRQFERAVTTWELERYLELI